MGNPGSYGEDEERELFQATDRHRIDNELEALGYVVIFEHLLLTRSGRHAESTHRTPLLDGQALPAGATRLGPETAPRGTCAVREGGGGPCRTSL
ncbi:hypothetical protein [Streptomyces gossypiisoli]|uniref:hypothetical protein n=1 Tax=Streptomyces gossypiisoli TaxID=2748864 RepID=UPI0015DA9153|nr:hypothetical protein [Streptomyces gossypiisoli]